MTSHLALVIVTYTCKCGHCWTHQRLGEPTLFGVSYALRIIDELNNESYDAKQVTHLVERNFSVPFCYRCLDLSKLIPSEPPQWHINRRASDPPTRKAPKPEVNLKDFLFGD